MSARLHFGRGSSACCPFDGAFAPGLELAGSAALLLGVVGGGMALLERHSVQQVLATSGWPGAWLLAMACFAVVAVATFVAAKRHLHRLHFGLANHLTLARGAIACVLVVMAIHPACEPLLLGWTCTVLGTAALLLDFADGQVARKAHTASRFGARFDMEMDALLVLSLTVLVARSDLLAALESLTAVAVPVVVLVAAGLARYAFVGAQLGVPALRRPLPFSRRRRTVCALHGIVLVALLAPPVSLLNTSAILVAVAAAAAVLVSFAIDLCWLLNHKAPREISG